MSPKPSEQLQTARDLIRNPENWITGNLAGFRDGHRTFCAVGALGQSVYGDVDAIPMNGELAYAPVWQYLLKGANDIQPTTVNDSYGHQAVINMFDAAIALALKDERGLGEVEGSTGCASPALDVDTATEESPESAQVGEKELVAV